jgi:hypothetical protein
MFSSVKQYLRKHINGFYTHQYYSVFLLFEKHTVKKTLVVRSGYFKNGISKYKALKGDKICKIIVD